MWGYDPSIVESIPPPPSSPLAPPPLLPPPPPYMPLLCAADRQSAGDVRIGAVELAAGPVQLTLPTSSRVTAIHCEDGLAERCAP